MHEGYKGLAELFINPEFWSHFFRGGAPDDGDWSALSAVDLLRQAEARVAQDGWTLLEDAVAIIRTAAPDQSPERYGCSSWRQVLHETRPIFTVRRERGDHLTPGKTWYRSSQVTDYESTSG